MYLVTTEQEFLGFQKTYEKINTPSILVKNLIRFLVITFTLNLVFYLFNTINLKID